MEGGGRIIARIYLDVYGCSANLADSEMASGLLVEAGHSITHNYDESDLSLILTCTVKTPTEKKILKEIRKLYNKGKPLIVAGCMPKAQRNQVYNAAPTASLLGPDDLLGVVNAVECSLNGLRVEEIDGEPFDRSCIPRFRKSSLIHIAPISSGCLGNCSYCIVKKARGHLYSFPAYGIIRDSVAAINEGCREIWVTAEDTAAYKDFNIRLPELLKSLNKLDGRFYIRVGMMTPNQALEILDELIEAYRSPKIFKFLHVPLQAGNNEVLGNMRRLYNVDDFKNLILEFRRKIPEITLSTDVICGFPGESSEQFMDTVRLIENIQPDILNISRFWARPNTDAADMSGQLHGRETKVRSRVLTNIFKEISLNQNKKWIGWEGEVLINEQGKESSVMGRNPSYKPVVIKKSLNLGDFVKVKIIDANTSYLIGNLI